MNKYLLLRDNKQSGPYTADELIKKGIKAYDLVWVEGKSAAWRYPSEIDELKAHAPATEEQPFERFYKKSDQPEKTNESTGAHNRYEPKPAASNSTAPKGSKKVYVNLPQNKQARTPATPAASSATPASPVPVPKQTDKTIAETPVHEPGHMSRDRQQSRYITPKDRNKLRIYLTVAASVLLISLLAYFLFNYSDDNTSRGDNTASVAPAEEVSTEANPQAVPAAILHDEIVPPPAAAADSSMEQAPALPAGSHSIPKKEKIEKSTEEPVIRFEEKNTTVGPKTKEEAREEKLMTGSETDLFKLVTVRPNEYKTGVLGGISNLQLYLTNNSAQPLQKVAVQIKYLGPEKRVVKTETVYFENVPPHGETKLDVPKSNRGVSIDYTITDIKS